MHELTDLMYRRLKKEHTREEVDALVREWLEGLGEPIMEATTNGWCGMKKLRPILGLTPKEEEGRPVGPQAWCEHCKEDEDYCVDFTYDNWRSRILWKNHHYIQFCPVCGAKRPAPRPKEETLEEKLFKEYQRLNSGRTDGMIEAVTFLKLAQIARDHYEGRPKEKREMSEFSDFWESRKGINCPTCDKGDVPDWLDEDGVQCLITGKKGYLCHASGEYWWRCKKDRYKRPYFMPAITRGDISFVGPAERSDAPKENK